MGGAGLILLLIITSPGSTLALLGVLPLHAARAATPVRGPEGEVDVLLGVQADNEGRDVHHLLADPGGGGQVKGGDTSVTRAEARGWVTAVLTAMPQSILTPWTQVFI